MRRLAATLCVVFVLLVSLPELAHAQWYVSAYLGANTTQPADIEIKADNFEAVFPDVSFEARPFESPQYYGWRLGRFLSDERRVGVELEFIHLKVIANPAQLLPDVQQYRMTHGLNFLVVNLVSRTPIGRSAYGEPRLAVMTRIGAGITVPHAETTVLGQLREQYEYAGPGGHAAVGVDLRLRSRLSLLTEYKVTYARPRISTAHNGTGQTTTLSHHLAVGFAFNVSR